jgi:predicted Ser/Thr protein kinase
MNPLASSTGVVQFLKNVRIGAKLGSGNFGEVYRGTWDGSEVACKKVSEDQAAEFQREANLLW